MGYRVAPADLELVRDHVFRIWSTNLPVGGALDEKLRWFYRDGPHGAGEGFVLEADEASAPVGYAGFGVRQLWFRGEPLPAALFADLAIDRAHRSGLPALVLVRAVRDRALEHLAVGYGFPNAKAAPVFRKAGYRELGSMTRFVRVLRSGPYLERRLPAVAARVLAAVVDRGLCLASRANALRDRDSRLVWLRDFDPRFDALWQQARDCAGVRCARTAEFLHWRFGGCPDRRYHVAALVERATDRLRAYAVIRDVDGMAELADLFGAGTRELDALLRQLVPALYDFGFRAIRFRFLGAPELPALLARHGFVRRREPRMVAIALGPGCNAALVDPAAWYLTDLDEDS